MTLTIHNLPSEHAEALFNKAELENLLFGGWSTTGLATQALVSASLRRIAEVTRVAERGYNAWELLTLAIETSEFLGSILLHFESPQSTRLHQATNTELTSIFTKYSKPLSPRTVQTFLRLPTPSEYRDTLVAASFNTLLHVGGRALRSIAEHWLHYIEAVRWFRHFPASLSISDIEAIDPAPSPSKLGIINDLATIPDLLDVSVVPDDEGFAYQAITLQDARNAAVVTSIAVQIILTRGANQYLERDSERDDLRLAKLYPCLVQGLSADNTVRLVAGGPYYLVR